MSRTHDPLDVVVCPGCGRTWQRWRIARDMQPGYPFTCTNQACGFAFLLEAPASVRDMLDGGGERCLSDDVRVHVLVRRVARLLDADPVRVTADAVVREARSLAHRLKVDSGWLNLETLAGLCGAVERFERALNDADVDRDMRADRRRGRVD